MTFYWILLGTLAGGIVSMAFAAGLAYSLLSDWVPRMVSYSVGVLLGVVFLDLLPETIEASNNAEALLALMLAGILAFFLLEKAALWRHSHEDDGHAMRKASGMLILTGDAFHNFVDGVLIAAAFLADFRLGVTTTLAVMVHEIPQEIGDFMVLLHAGYGRARALFLNAAVSVASVAGGVLGYLILDYAHSLIEYAVVLAAACFLYIAVADLIPHLHRQARSGEHWWQIGLIAVGVGSIGILKSLLH